MTLSGRFFKIGPARLFVHLAVLVIVVIWTDADARHLRQLPARQGSARRLPAGGPPSPGSSQNRGGRASGSRDQQVEQDGTVYVIAGNVLEATARPRRSARSACASSKPAAYKAGETADLGDGLSRSPSTMTAAIAITKTAAFGPDDARPARLHFASPRRRDFTLENYQDGSHQRRASASPSSTR